MSPSPEPLRERFGALLRDQDRPAVLLEGTRALPDEDRPLLVALAAMLAREFPSAVFRSGNAPGSDEAFAEGVAQIDASRLEYVLPYPMHRATMRHPSARSLGVDAEDEALRALTLAATPHYASLFARRDARSLASRKYLLRDTLKVVGCEKLGLAPATCGFFYVNASDPMKGGTGHTMRVCQTQQVLAVAQDEWMAWLDQRTG